MIKAERTRDNVLNAGVVADDEPRGGVVDKADLDGSKMPEEGVDSITAVVGRDVEDVKVVWFWL